VKDALGDPPDRGHSQFADTARYPLLVSWEPKAPSERKAVNEVENTKVALTFLAHLSDGEIEDAMDLIADDVVWWLAGEPEQFAIAGSKDKAQLAEMLATIGRGMPTGIRLTITGVTSEGDRVAVEMNADGISAIGRE
jgi:uncharacterized protein